MVRKGNLPFLRVAVWTMDYSPWSEGNFWLFLKASEKEPNLQTGEATPTKIGLYAFQVNLYLHEFFEPILFLTPMDYSSWFEGKFWPF